MISRFKIEPLGDGAYRTWIDDKHVRCREVDVRFRMDEIPTVRVDLVAAGEMDLECELELSDRNLLEMVEKRIGDWVFQESLKELMKRIQ